MKFKGTLIWAAVLMSLAAFVYLYEIKGGEKREQAAERAKKVLNFEDTNPQRLVLKRPQDTIVCQRTGQDWQILQPVNARGDEAAIRGVIGSLEGAQIERVVDVSGKNLADFGLDPPQVTMELEVEGDLGGILHLGQRNPTGTFCYAQKEGQETVFLTGVGLLTQGQKPLFDLRDKRTLFFQPTEVTGLALKKGRDTIEVRKSPPEGWSLRKPLVAPGDEAAIEALLRQLATTKVQSFVEEKPEDLVRYGLHQPELTVTLTLGRDDAQKRLLIGKDKDDQHYARDESRDPVFLIPSSLVQAVNKSPFDLRDKAVLHFDREQVDRLELISLDGTIICQRDTASQWQMVAPESSAVKDWKLQSILSSLSNLRAESFVSEAPANLSPYGLSSPRLRAVLTGNGAHLTTLLVGKDKGEQVYVCDGTGAPISLVAATILGTLSPELKDLKHTEASSE